MLGRKAKDRGLRLFGEEPRQNSFLYRTARPGVSGEFELKNIAPGQYTLFAWDGAPATSWLNSELTPTPVSIVPWTWSEAKTP
jgi:hypothetical protein